MRDPARIEEVLASLRQVWEGSPDLRLGQLIVTAVKPQQPCPELFYIEDDKLVRCLHSLLLVQSLSKRED